MLKIIFYNIIKNNLGPCSNTALYGKENVFEACNLSVNKTDVLCEVYGGTGH